MKKSCFGIYLCDKCINMTSYGVICDTKYFNSNRRSSCCAGLCFYGELEKTIENKI